VPLGKVVAGKLEEGNTPDSTDFRRELYHLEDSLGEEEVEDQKQNTPAKIH